ncbi:hypothetical protein [Paralcaligenes ureilyticus]|uniref:Uncharacterized protein n=1 Tax=Paralcaligenes ureilyticus TaxID=627131 RepID=A0A4R3M7L6_9BURK|nr:hypothetical protein [Paralcaligenes ureilyticus]TCT09481.1 hypothetical protein EDC26_10399 [Paralcaligenes ureilyticus]
MMDALIAGKYYRAPKQGIGKTENACTMAAVKLTSNTNAKPREVMMATKKPKANITIKDDGTPRARQTANILYIAEYASAIAAEPFTRGILPDVPINEMAFQVRDSINKVQAGDMSSMEAMLVGQAHALQQVFMNLMQRSGKQEQLKQLQTYMTMGLKAQAQCRATIQALTELKYPHQVVITKQANISNGHQQVNNGVGQNAASAPTPAAENVIEQNELLEHGHANTIPQRLDTRAPQAASREDPAMATLDTLHGSQDAGR